MRHRHSNGNSGKMRETVGDIGLTRRVPPMVYAGDNRQLISRSNKAHLG